MTTTSTGERDDLIATLQRHRGFLRYTTRDLDDEQAARRTTVSELCLGGLIKHVAQTEARWVDFAQRGPAAFPSWEADDLQAAIAAFASGFQMLPGETLAGLLADYEQVAARTDDLIATADLDASHALPQAPWFEPGARWTVRRVVLHIAAETAQHAGHADILREALDGQKTMG